MVSLRIFSVRLPIATLLVGRAGAAPDDVKRKTAKKAFSKRDFVSLRLAHVRRAPPRTGLKSPPAGHATNVDPFRRGAALVSMLNDRLDEPDSGYPGASMTFLATRSAKIDFDLTADDVREGRGEGARTVEPFFRTDASGAMK